MNATTPGREAPASARSPRSRGAWFAAGLGLLAVVVALLRHSSPVLPRDPDSRSSLPASASAAAARPTSTRDSISPGRFSKVASSSADPAAVVAAKLSRFAQSRRELARALAHRKGIEFPAAAERFFAAVESGDWPRIEAEFDAINGGDSSAGHASQRTPDISALWPAIIDAYGVAEQVHLWPPRQLLDYGQAILDSLRPGMVYVGGTDHGRWIPELLNETTDGERHLVVTQNAFADSAYLDYVRLQYEDQLVVPTNEEAEAVFQEYTTDARRRLEHDRDHPDEPKQIRPGEDVRLTDGNLQVSGSRAVMEINEKLLQILMAKNPDTRFAMEESFPLAGTYPNAAPLGPLMELGVADPAAAFTTEQATLTLDYWQTRTQDLLADPDATGSPSTMKSWSHDAVTAANLLASRQFIAEAEQSYLLARRLWPGNPETIAGLAEIYRRSDRTAEAAALIQNFQREYPDQGKDLEQAIQWTPGVGPGN